MTGAGEHVAVSLVKMVWKRNTSQSVGSGSSGVVDARGEERRLRWAAGRGMGLWYGL